MSIQQTLKETGLDQIIPNGVKKTKTPRQYDSILKGALGLEIHERVVLRKALEKSIDEEVKELRLAADKAEQLSKE